MKPVWSVLLALLAGVMPASRAAAQVTLYEGAAYAGRSFTTNRQVGDFRRQGLMRPAASAVVEGGLWEVCDEAWFSGECIVLRPGSYPNLAAMGLLNQPVAGRQVRDSGPTLSVYRFAPQPTMAKASLRPQ